MSEASTTVRNVYSALAAGDTNIAKDLMVRRSMDVPAPSNVGSSGNISGQQSHLYQCNLWELCPGSE